jgi:cytoskeleton protein RodZ
MSDAMPLTAGAWLRQQREAAHISLEALSVALKVRPARLQALESDQLGEMPDDLFVRSLALGICRHLKADESALLPLLPQSPQRDLRVGRNQTFAHPYNPNRWSGPMLFSPKRWPLKWAALGVFLALVGLLWFVGPGSNEIATPTANPTPTGASSAEGASGEAPAQASPTAASEMPATPVSGTTALHAARDTVAGKPGHSGPLSENMVITPVTPMALPQNPIQLPTQTTKP